MKVTNIQDSNRVRNMDSSHSSAEKHKSNFSNKESNKRIILKSNNSLLVVKAASWHRLSVASLWESPADG